MSRNRTPEDRIDALPFARFKDDFAINIGAFTADVNIAQDIVGDVPNEIGELVKLGGVLEIVSSYAA